MKKKRSFRQRIKRIIVSIIIGIAKPVFFCIIQNITRSLAASNYDRQKARTKLKYFKPTIHQGFMFTSIDWEMRDKPLSDEDVDQLENA